MSKSRSVPYKASETFLSFAFDPYKFIEEGIKIAEDNGLTISRQNSVTSGNEEYCLYPTNTSCTLFCHLISGEFL